MKLLMDPASAAAIVLLVSLLAYNAARDPDGEDELTVNSFWCVGICARLDGEHHSPRADEEQSNESTNSGDGSDTGGMRDNDNDG